MKKEIIDERGYIVTFYRCEKCNRVLFQIPGDYDEDRYGEWEFCPYCGKPIIYDDEM